MNVDGENKCKQLKLYIYFLFFNNSKVGEERFEQETLKHVLEASIFYILFFVSIYEQETLKQIIYA